MIVNISLDSRDPADAATLAKLFGGASSDKVNRGGEANFPTQSERQAAAKDKDPDPEPEPNEEPKLAAKKTTRRAPAKKAAPEPEPDEDDDVVGVDPLDVAVERATELVQNGGMPLVKKALAAVGAKKVSELKGAKIQGFLDALDEEAA